MQVCTQDEMGGRGSKKGNAGKLCQFGNGCLVALSVNSCKPWFVESYRVFHFMVHLPILSPLAVNSTTNHSSHQRTHVRQFAVEPVSSSLGNLVQLPCFGGGCNGCMLHMHLNITKKARCRTDLQCRVNLKWAIIHQEACTKI